MEVDMDAALESMSDCSGWSSSDDSDIDELLQDGDMEMMVAVLAVKDLEDHKKLLDQRKGSQIGRICIERNRALGHEQLMQDYFAEEIYYVESTSTTAKINFSEQEVENLELIEDGLQG